MLKFDRVLCDVPCSGDATLRKNPDIWLKWSVGNGNNLHGIQYRILKRGAEMLAVGGRLVYSTCSFNPVENEAVIHRVLQETGDCLELVDAAPMLPNLNYNKGMSYWKPASKDMVFYEKYEDVPEKWTTVVRPQMFPPDPEDAQKYHLDRWGKSMVRDATCVNTFAAAHLAHTSRMAEAAAEAAANKKREKIRDISGYDAGNRIMLHQHFANGIVRMYP